MWERGGGGILFLAGGAITEKLWVAARKASVDWDADFPGAGVRGEFSG